MDPTMEAEARERVRQMLLTPPIQRPADFVNPLEKIEQLLTCPICLDRYKSPKLLPCQHTFCYPCLESCADTLHRQLKCPECRAEHNIPYEGVKAFQTNYTLTGFLDIHLESTSETAAQIEEYIHRYNLERCKVCDEKADCDNCAHCDKRACSDCRKTHMDMLKRDMSRLLMQVKRLSNRITEASDGLSKGLELLSLNCETSKQEVVEYFQRFRRELKKREEMFLSEIDTFQSTESRLMSNLRDILEIESSNMSEAVSRVDAVLKGECAMDDVEIVRYKNIFAEGLEYLKHFSPDADELFCKKLRFLAGDDASKLPQAIQTFGDLSVLVPQFSGRYVPLEQSYLPRTMKIGLESDYFRLRSDENARERERANEMTSRPMSRYGNRDNEPEQGIRYRRRQQLEEEAWNRVRGNTDRHSGVYDQTPSIPGKSPWSSLPEATPTTQNATTNLAVPTGKPPAAPAQGGSSTTSTSVSKTSSLLFPRTPEPSPVTNSTTPPSVTSSSTASVAEPVLSTLSPIARVQIPPPVISITKEEPKLEDPPKMVVTKKPPLPRQSSIQDESLNEKVDNIRKVHEKRSRPEPFISEQSSMEKDDSDIPEEERPRARFRIRMRASSVTRQESQDERETPIPITHYPGEEEVPSWLQRRRQRYQRSKTNPDLHLQFASARVQQLLQEREERLSEPEQDDRSRIRTRRQSIGRDASDSRTRASGDYRGKGRPKNIFGRKGQKDGELNWPRGLCVIPGGQIGVCDSSNHRISIFSQHGDLIKTFGAYGSGRGQLDSCAGIACGRGRQLIVSDRYNHRVCVFDYDGNVLNIFGGHGPANGKFNNPWGVAVDDMGTLYVVDKDNHRVQMFDKNGVFVGKFGTHGQSEGHLNNPLFIAVNRINHTVYVTDSSNHRVSAFDMQGQYLFSFGSEGFHGGQFKFPRGITVDNKGNVIVVDSGNNRVQVFTSEGEFQAAFGSWGSGAGQLKGAEDVILINDTLVVSDRENHRIQLF